MNRLLLIGRLTKDVELRYLPSGKAVTSLNLAVDDWNGKEKTTLWVKCSLFGQRAESLAQYLTKGTQVFVEGKLNHEEGNPRLWGDPPRASFEMMATDITLLGGGKKTEEVDEDMPF